MGEPIDKNTLLSSTNTNENKLLGYKINFNEISEEEYIKLGSDAIQKAIKEDIFKDFILFNDIDINSLNNEVLTNFLNNTITEINKQKPNNKFKINIDEQFIFCYKRIMESMKSDDLIINKKKIKEIHNNIFSSFNTLFNHGLINTKIKWKLYNAVLYRNAIIEKNKEKFNHSFNSLIILQVNICKLYEKNRKYQRTIDKIKTVIPEDINKELHKLQKEAINFYLELLYNISGKIIKILSELIEQSSDGEILQIVKPMMDSLINYQNIFSTSTKQLNTNNKRINEILLKMINKSNNILENTTINLIDDNLYTKYKLE
jgi:FtsZ-binding cell division protein ZapB